MFGDVRFLFAGPPRVEYIKKTSIITKVLHQKNGSIYQKNGWVFDLALCLAKASWPYTFPFPFAAGCSPFSHVRSAASNFLCETKSMKSMRSMKSMKSMKSMAVSD